MTRTNQNFASRQEYLNAYHSALHLAQFIKTRHPELIGELTEYIISKRESYGGNYFLYECITMELNKFFSLCPAEDETALKPLADLAGESFRAQEIRRSDDDYY